MGILVLVISVLIVWAACDVLMAVPHVMTLAVPPTWLWGFGALALVTWLMRD